jgi:hypothetical protein
LAYDAQMRFKSEDFDPLCCWRTWHHFPLQTKTNEYTASSVVLQRMSKSARSPAASTFLSARRSTRNGLMIIVCSSHSRSNSWQCLRASRSANRREGTSIRQGEIILILSNSLKEHSLSQLLVCNWILMLRWEQLDMIDRNLMRFISALFIWEQKNTLNSEEIPVRDFIYPHKVFSEEPEIKFNLGRNQLSNAQVSLRDVVNRETI